jgi:hypothetical protein
MDKIKIFLPKLVLMYVNGKMRPVETILGMGEGNERE